MQIDELTIRRADKEMMKDGAQVIAELTATNSELRNKIKELEGALELQSTKHQKRAYSPREIAGIRIKELPLSGRWELAFGHPGINETWFVTGQSASGKSSFVMQLAKMLCEFGTVLYLSLEEGVGKSFQNRMELFDMKDVQGRFRVILDSGIDELRDRLRKPKSPSFIIVDSFQYTGWDYMETKELVDAFPRKSFIFVSQEDKGRPLGKAAVRLKYMSGVKIRTVGFRAFCQGRYIGSEESYYTIWSEKALLTWNDV
jgi:hypothetical protein